MRQLRINAWRHGWLLLSAVLAACCEDDEQLTRPQREGSTNDAVEVGAWSEVGLAYSGTSVNTVVFRSAALCTADSAGQLLQFAAYYDNNAHLVLARRKLDPEAHPASLWQRHDTGVIGNVGDAHCCASLATDRLGVLHVSYNHHCNPLHYRHSTRPYGLELGEEMPMTGLAESAVTYPQFVRLSTGELLFAYRDGGSGNGNMILNAYDEAQGTWQQLLVNLIDGEGQRSPYWEMCPGAKGDLLVAWCWRETGDVATNHDKLFARSPDGGRTWLRSDGRAYELPINQSSAELALAIPQRSDLMNQTAVACDGKGLCHMATYYTAAGDRVPAMHIVSQTYLGRQGWNWRSCLVAHTTQPFHLAGGGTKFIPFGRPKLVVKDRTALLIWRDGDKVYYARNRDIDAPGGRWQVGVLLDEDLGAWEPMIDEQLWQDKHILHLVVQHSYQGDGEVALEREATPARVAEVKF